MDRGPGERLLSSDRERRSRDWHRVSGNDERLYLSSRGSRVSFLVRSGDTVNGCEWVVHVPQLLRESAARVPVILNPPALSLVAVFGAYNRIVEQQTEGKLRSRSSQ